MKKKNRLYNPILKDKAVGLLRRRTPVKDVAKQLGLKEHTVYGWQNRLRAKIATGKETWAVHEGVRPLKKPLPEKSVRPGRPPARAASLLPGPGEMRPFIPRSTKSEFSRGVAFGFALQHMQSILLSYQMEPELQTAVGIDKFINQMSHLLNTIKR